MISTPGIIFQWLHIPTTPTPTTTPPVQTKGTEMKSGKINIEEKTHLSQIRLI